MKFFEVSTNPLDYRWFWLTVGRFALVTNRPSYFRWRPEIRDWRKLNNDPGWQQVASPNYEYPISFYWLWFALHWTVKQGAN